MLSHLKPQHSTEAVSQKRNLASFIFSTAGVLINKVRSRLSLSVIDQIISWNKKTTHVIMKI